MVDFIVRQKRTKSKQLVKFKAKNNNDKDPNVRTVRVGFNTKDREYMEFKIHRRPVRRVKVHYKTKDGKGVINRILPVRD